jgi:hypothetical protein
MKDIMKIRLIFTIVLTIVLNSCFEREQWPQGIIGPKGDNGKDYVEHDSTLIGTNNKIRVSATREWIKSGVSINFGDKFLMKTSTNMPYSASIGGLSAFLVKTNKSIHFI